MDDVNLSSSPPNSCEGVYVANSEAYRAAEENEVAKMHESGPVSGPGLGLGLNIGTHSGTGPTNNNDGRQQQGSACLPHQRSNIPIPRINTSTNVRQQQHKQPQNRQQANTMQSGVMDTTSQNQLQKEHTRNLSAGPLPWEALGSNSPIASPNLNNNSNNNSPQFPAYAFANSYSASPSPDAFGVVTSLYSTNNSNNNNTNSINSGALKKLANKRGSPKLNASSNMRSGASTKPKMTSQEARRREWKGPSGRHAILDVPVDKPPAPPAKDYFSSSPVTPITGKLMSASASGAQSSSQARKKPSPIITSGGSMGIASPITAIPQIYSNPLSASAAPLSNKAVQISQLSTAGVTARKPVPTTTRVAGLLTPTSPNTTHANYPNDIYNNSKESAAMLTNHANGNLIVNGERHAFTQAGIPPSLPLATPTPRSATMLTQWPAVVRAFSGPYSPSSPLAEMGYNNDRNGAAVTAGGPDPDFYHAGEANRNVSPLGSDNGLLLGSKGETRDVSPVRTPVAQQQRQHNKQSNQGSLKDGEDDDNDDDDESRIEVIEQINRDDQDENPAVSRFSWSTHATGTTRQSSAYSPPASPVPPLPSMGMSVSNTNSLRRQRALNFNNLDIDLNRISNMSESMVPAPLSVGSADGKRTSSTQNHKAGTMASQLVAAQALLGSSSVAKSSEPRESISARQSSLPPGVGSGRTTNFTAAADSKAATTTPSPSSSTGTIPSALNRKSPLSSSSPNTTSQSVPGRISSTSPNPKPASDTTATTSTTIIAQSTTNIKSKALPLSPPEQLASGDLITTLEAQLDDFRIRRRNIEKCIQKNEGLLNGTASATASISSLSSSSTTGTSTPTTSTRTTATSSPITPLIASLPRSTATAGIDLSMSQRRQIEAQIRSFRGELDEIGRSEHEIGMRLHRAWKRHREREMEGLGSGDVREGGSCGWETGIWVRRVTG